MARKSKPIVTIVGLKQSKEGFVFLHEGPVKGCGGCERYNVCMKNLEPGRVYKIVGLREKTFPCRIHEEGARVVEVVESEIAAVIEARLAFQGGIITFQPQRCGEISCPNHGRCVPTGLLGGDRCKVLKVGRQANCLLGQPLFLSVLLRMPE
ncbi:MAG: UPF0179 family protein [Candidatus Bathyarchaeia archaeon]